MLVSLTNSSILLSQYPDFTNTTSTTAQAHTFASNQGPRSNVTLVFPLREDYNDLNISETMPSETSMQAPTKCVPTLGASAKSLHLKPLATLKNQVPQRIMTPIIVGNQLAALWPISK